MEISQSLNILLMMSMQDRKREEERMEMRLRENGPDGYDTIYLKGDCDLYSAPGMRKAIINRIGLGRTKLRLDLSGVEYLDSTGVGAVIQILQAMRAAGGAVVFRGIQGSPRRVLEMSNIISILKIESPETV